MPAASFQTPLQCALLVQSLDDVSVERHTLRVGVLEARARLADLDGDHAGADALLADALNTQTSLLSCLRSEFDDIVDDAKARLCTLARRVAAVHVAARRFSDARVVLAAAVAAAPCDAATILDLARLGLCTGELQECVQLVRCPLPLLEAE
jgi:hypothetical protein